MFFNRQNQALLQDIYIHDSYFTGFYFDYCKKELRFSCQNDYENKVLSFLFSHVIYVNLQSCNLWHGGNRILWLNLVEGQPELHELRQRKREAEAKEPKVDRKVLEQAQELLKKNPTLCAMCDEMKKNLGGLKDDVDYLEIEFQLSSGDTLRIICESISIETTQAT